MDATLYTDDIVALADDNEQLGVVERTHEDVNTHAPLLDRGRGSHDAPPFMSPHKDMPESAFQAFCATGIPPKGTVVIRWTHSLFAELIFGTALKLLDRSLLTGDIVKRSVRDAMSGVVISTFTKCKLQPMGEVLYRNDGEKPMKGLMSLIRPVRELTPVNLPSAILDVPASELCYAESPSEEEVIIYKDWLGRVDGLRCNITLKLMDNCVVEIEDHLAFHADDAADVFFVGDIARTKKGHLRTGKWIYGQYNPNTPPVGTVVSTRATSAHVIWLRSRPGGGVDPEPPEILERDELESADFHVYDRARQPPKPPGDEQAQTPHDMISNPEVDIRIGLRVRFNDIVGACVKYDGSTYHGKLSRTSRGENMGYDLNVFDVIELHTEVTVQWQDLSITREKSTALVPDTDLEDRHAAWPGEIAHTSDTTPVPGLSNVQQASKVGVIQSVKPAERMTTIRWCPTGQMHFSVDPDDESAYKTLVRSVVGEAAGEPQEVSLYDVEAHGEVNVRRGDIGLVANKTWASQTGPPSMQNMEWIGQIVDTKLDGTLVLRLGAATPVQDVIVRREDIVIALRSDGADQLGPMDEGQAGEEGEWEYDSMYEDDEDFDENMEDWGRQDSYEDGNGQVIDPWNILNPWDHPGTTYEDEHGQVLDEEDVEGGDWVSDDEGDKPMKDVQDSSPPPENPDSTPEIGNSATTTIEEATSVPSVKLHEGPEQYEILSSEVPVSHHFSTTAQFPSPMHTKRTQKEHQILGKPGSLPEGVYIRTWESRLDLMRALFIGPEETPYAHAPFVVDFHLPPNFPTEPPVAFFHSWPAIDGGAGRVNPNLYEDGKICLSILGTWEGTKGEGWNGARSTLLQVIVSLLGLVLVPEPYFNEAGFEHLAGLEGSARPSALYNERTFLRARGFAATALSRLHDGPSTANGGEQEPRGLEGVADILTWLYTSPQGPRLVDRVVKDVEQVLTKSAKNAGAEPDGKTVMSMGACVPLRRTLDRLRGFT